MIAKLKKRDVVFAFVFAFFFGLFNAYGRVLKDVSKLESIDKMIIVYNTIIITFAMAVFYLALKGTMLRCKRINYLAPIKRGGIREIGSILFIVLW